MLRCSLIPAILLLVVVPLAAQQDAEAFLESVRQEVGEDPLALERVLRERLPAAADQATRADLTAGLARLLITHADRPAEGVEVVRAAEGWAAPAMADSIVRSVAAMVMDRRTAAKALEAAQAALGEHPGSRTLWVLTAILRA